MDTLQTEKIVNVLNDSGAQGISLMKLSLKTRIRMVELHSFFRAHKKLFETAGGLSKYRLIQRAPIAGNAALVRSLLDEERTKQKQQEMMAYGVVCFAVLYSLVLTLFVAN